ncbi:hypothetical protein D3H65_10850 [Paraflavitalea soli]|uniref:Glycosyltransferase subfamily 4-like N-terminal domain-containing protein n=1 Tax=Paraflavitalea soli TaxID=2315862 RepID=A0A3B7MJ18_9BACT|nr:glycosyltransferase [Paraflavitalea soli]AXY74444.1 hypothetical protein D3H65_10850 [Paraflavitalea soli]
MTVGIFETEHFEGSYPVIRLFDNGENQLTIFTNKESYRQFQWLFGNDINRYTWVVQEEKESKYRFVLRMYKEVKRRKIDLLYLNTISHNFIVYAGMISLLRNTRVVVTLHAVNNYFRFKPAFSLRRWVRHIGKRALIKVTKEFNVVSDTMVAYLTALLPAHKKVHNLPGAVFERAALPPTTPVINGQLQLVVPGSIDARRRDYTVVLDLLEQGRHLPLRIVLLGPFVHPHGDAIREKCMRYAADNSNLVFYDNQVVDQPEFDRVMDEAHIVFTPSVIDTIMVDEVMETYGKSICSGNIFDIIKHAKPFITPQALTIPANLASSAIPYNKVSGIIQALELLLQEPARYATLLQEAQRNSEAYTIAQVRARNPMLFALLS